MNRFLFDRTFRHRQVVITYLATSLSHGSGIIRFPIAQTGHAVTVGCSGNWGRENAFQGQRV